MIKENTATRIILGIALVAIWGLVIYRIVDAMKGKDTPTVEPIAYWLEETNTNTDKTYQLHLGYNDPFFKKNHLSINNVIDTTLYVIPKDSLQPAAVTTIATLLPTPPKKIQFPKLSYMGCIINKKTGKKLAVMKHKNTVYQVQIGDKVSNCSVISIQRDSVQVSLKGQIQSVLR